MRTISRGSFSLFHFVSIVFCFELLVIFCTLRPSVLCRHRLCTYVTFILLLCFHTTILNDLNSEILDTHYLVCYDLSWAKNRGKKYSEDTPLNLINCILKPFILLFIFVYDLLLWLSWQSRGNIFIIPFWIPITIF